MQLTLCRGVLLGLTAIPAFLALAAPNAIAATISVTSTADVVDGGPPCTLREAIQSSNTDGGVGGCSSGSGVDRIELPAGTFVLAITAPEEDAAASGDLDLAQIVGAGRDATIIDGNGSTVGERVFDLLAGPVALSDLAITGGMSSTGGGLRSSASFELSRVDMVGNTASFRGGAVFADGLFADGVSDEVSDSAFVGNRAAGTAVPAGGAIHNMGGNNLLIRRSTFTGNDAEDTDDGFGAEGAGGAISNSNSGTAEIRDSVISGNQTDRGGFGGGVFNTTSGTLIVRRTTISGNTAEAGGGVYNANFGSNATEIVNSTISGNDANDSGGGIYAGGSSASLLASTVTNNRADLDADGSGDGGGLVAAAGNSASGPATDLNSSVVAGNSDLGPGTARHECSGGLRTLSYSLVGDSSCSVVEAPTSNLDPATDPMLEPLAANGGIGQTHALAEGSPLIDAGSPEPATRRPRGSRSS